MPDITHVLSEIESGDAGAAQRLLELVYDELRQLAAAKMSREKPGQTLQPTALVHEAYMRLVHSSGQRWDSRGHFFAAAAEAMRRILVENARHKRSQRAGGEWQRVQLSEIEVAAPEPEVDVLALSEALDELEARDRRKAALVKLRYFAGFTNQEAADALGISAATADNDWAYAKSWLKLQLDRDSTGLAE
jgi:RNA polymerase sigma factor (TIGR02999 family)